LLTFGPVTDEQRGDQLHQPALIGNRRITAAEFLHHDRIGQRIEARSAEVFGNADTEQSELRHFPVKVCGETFLAVERLRHRPDHFIGERARHITHLLLYFR
jgi:hypothetical protein